MRKLFLVLFVVALAIMLVLPTAAQDTPSVSVVDQVSTNGAVVIDSVYSEGPGFVVIHIDNGGSPGPVAGVSAVGAGWTHNLHVDVDTAMVTPMVFAMLHTDDNAVGTYEFGTVEGADAPVSVDGNVVTPAFNIELIQADDQFIDGGVMINSVVTQQDGFVVIHADNGEGSFGAVIGYAPITAGQNSMISVELMGDATAVVYPMLHVDTGVAGEYEFGTVEGADGPVVIDGTVAVFPITVGTAAMRVPDQIVTDHVWASSVLSEGLGWLVIHQDNGEGGPGPVIGQAQVQPGTNTGVVVEVDPAGVTPMLFPMLHVDTGVEGTYEFGTVEGADGPVMVNDAVLVYGINAAPAIWYTGHLEGTSLHIDGALIDQPGWLVIHDDNAGAPGPVLGYTAIHPGFNGHITVEITGTMSSDTVFPMLHYDTGEPGVYEFGTVEGADSPVRVADAVVVGPFTPMMEG